MTKTEKTDHSKHCCGGVRSNGDLTECCEGTHALLKAVWQFLKEVNTHLQYDPVILLLVTYTREVEADIYSKTCPRTSIAALLLMPKLKTTYRQGNEWTNGDLTIQRNTTQQKGMDS